MGSLTLGIDLGQRVDPTALVLAEQEYRMTDGVWETHFTIRFLERLPLGTPYPKVVEAIAARLAALRARQVAAPTILADATGVGLPVVDMMKQRGIGVMPVLFNHGDKRKYEKGRMSLGKAFLVSRLKTLLQGERLHLPPQSAEAAAMAAELIIYEIRLSEDADFKAGAFKVGQHDDLVTAMGLATLVDVAPVTGVAFLPKRPAGESGDRFGRYSPPGAAHIKR